MLLGLDPAPHLTGYCVGDGSVPPIAGAWSLPDVTTKEGADYGWLLDSLHDYLDITFNRFPNISAAGYESPILMTRGPGRPYGDKLSTLRLIYPLGPHIEWYCRRIAHVPCHEITLQDAKKEITGNVHAEKEDIALLAEKCGVILPKAGRHDAGDGFAVWKRLLRNYDRVQSERWDVLIRRPKGALL